MATLFAHLAAYNAWANARLYDAAATLSEPEYRADRGAFFRSMHGTLNHLLVADRIWMRRFTGEGEAPDRLDAILHESFDDLRAARAAEDRRIQAWAGALTAADLARTLRYRPISDPAEVERPLAPLVLHMFNHQTHHRGQAHAILTGLGRDAPSLDLLPFQRETGSDLTL